MRVGHLAEDVSASTRFDQLWTNALPALRAYCRRNTPSSVDADELLGNVAERAWRGFSSFRGEASFVTWVLRIAEREAARRGRRHQIRTAREVPFETAQHEFPAPSAPTGTGREVDVHRLVVCAAEHGELSAVEHRVVLARVADPRPTWMEVAATIGLSADACAIAHSRAIPKLRVHMLLHHIDELGGRSAVREAFDAVRRRVPAAITQAQAEAFDLVVLQGRSDHHRRGGRTALRVVAGLVVAELIG